MLMNLATLSNRNSPSDRRGPNRTDHLLAMFMAQAEEHFAQFNPMWLTQPDQRQSNRRRH
jgi:hypothetical protein